MSSPDCSDLSCKIWILAPLCVMPLLACKVIYLLQRCQAGEQGSCARVQHKAGGFPEASSSKTQLEVKGSQLVLGVMHVPSVGWKGDWNPGQKPSERRI